jgi:hypothetical protein
MRRGAPRGWRPESVVDVSHVGSLGVAHAGQHLDNLLGSDALHVFEEALEVAGVELRAEGAVPGNEFEQLEGCFLSAALLGPDECLELGVVDGRHRLRLLRSAS